MLTKSFAYGQSRVNLGWLWLRYIAGYDLYRSLRLATSTLRVLEFLSTPWEKENRISLQRITTVSKETHYHREEDRSQAGTYSQTQRMYIVHPYYIPQYNLPRTIKAVELWLGYITFY